MEIQKINTNDIANIPNNTNQIPKIGINGPSIIPTIEPPVVKSTEVPVVRGLALPVFQMPDTSIKYPVIDVPTQEEFDAAVKAEREKQAAEQQEKTRGLPDTTPPPQLPQIVQTPTIQTAISPIAEIAANKPPTPTFTVGGIDINLPDPSLVATAGAVAVVTTAATIASTTALNA